MDPTYGLWENVILEEGISWMVLVMRVMVTTPPLGYGDVISCVITNTPKPPTITLSKALGGARIANTDQFTVQIKNGATVSSSATTAGTGSSALQQ